MPYKEENISIAGGTIVFAGGLPGYTRDAITIGQEDDKVTIDDVQQIQGVIDVRRIKVGFVVKANLYENTLENWKSAFGINAEIEESPVKAEGTRLKLDVSGDYPEGELIIYGKGESNVARTYKFYKAKLIDRGEASLDAHNATVIPVTWKILIHPDYTEIGVIDQEKLPT